MNPNHPAIPPTPPSPLPAALFDIDWQDHKVSAPPGLASVLGILIFVVVSLGSVVSIVCLL